MNKTKQLQWWNPFSWIEAILQTVGAVLRDIFALFGMMSSPPTSGHENIQMDDVSAAEKDARKEQEAIDEIFADMTPAQIVHAYCTTSEDARKTIDLSPLTVEQQDWLMRLSDADLVMLGKSGEAACKVTARLLPRGICLDACGDLFVEDEAIEELLPCFRRPTRVAEHLPEFVNAIVCQS